MFNNNDCWFSTKKSYEKTAYNSPQNFFDSTVTSVVAKNKVLTQFEAEVHREIGDLEY